MRDSREVFAVTAGLTVFGVLAIITAESPQETFSRILIIALAAGSLAHIRGLFDRGEGDA